MDTGLLARLSPTLVVGALVGWMAATAIGLSAGSVPATVVLRTLLTALVLLLLTRIFVRRAVAGPALVPTLAVAAVASYALSPTAWAGRALVGQLVLEPGLFTVIVDLLVWVGVVLGAGATVEAVTEDERLPYQLS